MPLKHTISNETGEGICYKTHHVEKGYAFCNLVARVEEGQVKDGGGELDCQSAFGNTKPRYNILTKPASTIPRQMRAPRIPPKLCTAAEAAAIVPTKTQL